LNRALVAGGAISQKVPAEEKGLRRLFVAGRSRGESVGG